MNILRFKVYVSILFLFLSFFVKTKSWGEEKNIAIFKIILNTEDKGVFFVLYKNKTDVLVQFSDLKMIGFNKIPRNTKKDEDGYISLNSLAPFVYYEIRESDTTLILNADPEYLGNSIINLGRKKSADVTYINENSAYVNYQIRYRFDTNHDVQTFNLPGEVGIKTGPFFTHANFIYNKDIYQENFQRGMTNITIDNPQKNQSIVMGDIIASSLGGVGSSSLLGGFSITKNFSLSPYFVKTPTFELSGILESPSEVELYVNENLIARELLPPGKFVFQNLPAYSGTGETVMVIKDAYGRVEKIVTPFNISSDLLKPGLHEYSYNAGYMRSTTHNRVFQYNQPAFVAFHRIGISSSITTGYRIEYREDRYNFGPTLSMAAGRRGRLNSSVAVSSYQDKSGFGTSFVYTNNFKKIGLRFTFNSFSKDYITINSIPSKEAPKIVALIGIGLYDRILGSFSLAYNYTRRHSDIETKVSSVSFNRIFYNKISLFINARRYGDSYNTERKTNEILLGINYFWGKTTCNLDHQIINENKFFQISIQNNQSSDRENTSYRLGYQKSYVGIGDPTTNANATYYNYGKYANYSAEVYRNNRSQKNYDNYFLKYSAGISFVDGSFFFSKPIRSSFGVAKVGDIEGVKVSLQNREIGTTDKTGRVFIPGLIANYENKVSIISDKIPIEYEILETTKYISLPNKSGGVIEFKIKKFQAFEGILFFKNKGKKISAEYADFDIELENGTFEIIVGKNGQFYIDNVTPGTYPVKLHKENLECQFDLILLQSNDLIVDLGEIGCEIK